MDTFFPKHDMQQEGMLLLLKPNDAEYFHRGFIQYSKTRKILETTSS